MKVYCYTNNQIFIFVNKCKSSKHTPLAHCSYSFAPPMAPLFLVTFGLLEKFSIFINILHSLRDQLGQAFRLPHYYRHQAQHWYYTRSITSMSL